MSRILLLDDDSQMRIIVPRTLKDYDVVAANGVANAREALRDNPDFQLYLTDFQMPGRNGLDFLRSMQGYQYPRRIMYSSRADQDLCNHVLRLGGDGLIAKPFEGELLRTVVSELIAGCSSPTLETYMQKMQAKKWIV